MGDPEGLLFPVAERCHACGFCVVSQAIWNQTAELQGSANIGCAEFNASCCCTVQDLRRSKLLSVCRDTGWQLSDHCDWDAETGGVGSQPCHPEAPAVSSAGRSLLDTLVRL